MNLSALPTNLAVIELSTKREKVLLCLTKETGKGSSTFAVGFFF
jgi:hypothetical protein